jgi:hypothetical protein
MKNIEHIITNIINKVSKTLTQWENRRLLAKINRVYENNDFDAEEEKLLKAYRKSFRKLIKDKW